MKNRITSILLAVLIAAFALSCGGGSSVPPPDDSFQRLTAQVLTTNGQPVPGLEVRVEGAKTGITTDASGSFVLLPAAFPNGITSNNEIALGENGVVVATRTIIPVDSPQLTFQFGESGGPGNGTGTGSVSGIARDEAGGTPLSGVEVTLFSLDLGLMQDTTAADGAFSFTNVGAGSWQIVAFLDAYYPEMAFLTLGDGENLTHDVALGKEGAVAPGEGIKVRGTLTDSKTGSPISGALVSMMADTGYMGMPEPAVYDDMMGKPDNTPGTGSGGATGADGRGASMAMPFYYDPQYQETTTGADGSFEFDNAVVGYSLYFNLNAEGYFAGTWYESIDGRSTDLDLALTLDPMVMTSISGVVKNGDGAPVEGALVEYIYSGGFGGPMPMEGDVALPPAFDLDGMAEDGVGMRDEFGTPPPPMVPPTDASGANGEPMGWEDADSVFSPGAAPGAGGGEGGSDSGLDNQLMQKFRFEHQNGRGASDIGMPFNGYLSTVTGADGTFNFEEAPAGPYYVIVSAYRHIPYSGEFTASEVPEENTQEIVIEEVPVGSVEGTVTDADTNEPIEDVLVNATQPNVDPFTYTDASGHYRIDNIPEGQWIISAFKSGYLTVSQTTDITENGVALINLQVQKYEAPPVDLLNFGGQVYDGTSGYDGADGGLTGIEDATLVFTPVAPELGGYYRHITSGANGNFSVDLINNTDYNLLIQATDYQDLYTRIWTDVSWPKMDFGLWPIKGGPGGGGGGVIVGPPMPPVPGDPGTDPSGGTGGEPRPM